MWIVENLFEELDLPNPPNSTSDAGAPLRGSVWQEMDYEDAEYHTSANMIYDLDQHIDGTQLAAIGAMEHESDLFEGIPRIQCRSKYSGAARKAEYCAYFYKLLHISCILVTHYSIVSLQIVTHCYTMSRCFQDCFATIPPHPYYYLGDPSNFSFWHGEFSMV